MSEPASAEGANWNDPDDMLRLGRAALANWRKARDKTAAERHAARLLAFAFGRLLDLASDRRLPSEWFASGDAAGGHGARGESGTGPHEPRETAADRPEQ